MRARRWAGAALLVVAAAAPAAGQRVVAGFPRVNQSDITGPAVTSGDLLNWEPGTVQTLNCAAAWGLLAEGRALNGELDTLALATGDANVLRAPSAAAQGDVGALLAGGTGAAPAAERIRQALVAGNPGAAPAAARLVAVAEGLLAAVERIDPLRPGRRAPTQLHRAVGAWDELVEASSDAFLAAPPDAFVALGAVLGRLDRAAIEHAARVGDPRRVDEFGAACAPPAPPVGDAPAAVDFGACVLDGGDFRLVRGVYLPATGDSLVEVDGARRPLRQAYPGAGYALGRGWFSRDTAIVVFGRRYVQWGMSRVVSPGELAPAAWFEGVPVFTAPGGGSPPEVVYVPFRPACEVQPYRRADEARRVRGG